MPDLEGKPIRMRGYYRAVKRGDSWAVKIENQRGNVFGYYLALFFRNVDLKSELSKPSMFDRIKKDDSWTGGYLPVPFGTGKKNDT